MRGMELQRPFATITPTVDGEVLVVLARSDSAFTAGQVHRLMGTHSYSGVVKALGRLVDHGAVRSERVGIANVFALNREHLAAGAIIELAGLRAAFLDRLRGVLDSWDPAPIYAALFGSAARGDMNIHSDIDVFVVRPEGEGVIDELALGRWHDNVNLLEESVAAWTGNDARVYEVGEIELRRSLKNRDPVLESIRAEGVTLIGPLTYWTERVHGRK